jgi:hypothetical protein
MKIEKVLAFGVVVALVIATIGIITPTAKMTLSGSTSDSFNADGGFLVGNTVVIDGSGNVDAPITSTSLSVSGESSVQGFTQGGGVLSFTATSTQAARTLTEAEMIASNVIDIVSTSSPALTLTLPATSTMTTLLPNAGDMREWFIDNQHLAATTTTIAAGTGIDLIAVTANDDVIDGQEVSRLTCIRKADTDVYCIVSELLKAD